MAVKLSKAAKARVKRMSSGDRKALLKAALSQVVVILR
jgi:hypothetical protein